MGADILRLSTLLPWRLSNCVNGTDSLSYSPNVFLIPISHIDSVSMATVSSKAIFNSIKKGSIRVLKAVNNQNDGSIYSEKEKTELKKIEQAGLSPREANFYKKSQ